MGIVKTAPLPARGQGALVGLLGLTSFEATRGVIAAPLNMTLGERVGTLIGCLGWLCDSDQWDQAMRAAREMWEDESGSAARLLPDGVPGPLLRVISALD